MNYVKVTSLLLLSILPFSLIGYWFAVDHEHLFFLYEGALLFIILATFFFAIKGVSKDKKNKWTLISTLGFTFQMAILFLFLGPFTHYVFILIYYVATIVAAIMMIMSLKKMHKNRYLPITFLVISIISTLYVILLNNLWGSNLSFILF
ncbi:hypothetical protein [Peribacillus alkalitolerans]|uniref:hypothetical protein n=1 Tax=Peribacillus alkalitolerans TaxID=1550385 RepID=UPI0013D776EE|nr:hypothetical protein [Peribacillus alkalitolerans]